MRTSALLAVVALGTTALAAWLAVSALGGPAGEGVPAAYAGRINPRAGDAAAIAAGAAVFRDNCASCHGLRGDGRGPAATGLTPAPARFRGSDLLGHHSDAYLFYRISAGKPGTAMPSFHGALGEDERWAVIAFLRTLDEAAAR